jgi:hypothetical protein
MIVVVIRKHRNHHDHHRRRRHRHQHHHQQQQQQQTMQPWPSHVIATLHTDMQMIWLLMSASIHNMACTNIREIWLKNKTCSLTMRPHTSSMLQ